MQMYVVGIHGASRLSRRNINVFCWYAYILREHNCRSIAATL